MFGCCCCPCFSGCCDWICANALYDVGNDNSDHSTNEDTDNVSDINKRNDECVCEPCANLFS